MDPKWGPELDHIFILLLGRCLGPVLGSRFGPKSGVSHRRILLLPGEVLQADLRRTSMSVSFNTCFFSLCVPLCFLYSSNRTWDAQREKRYELTFMFKLQGWQICLHNMCGQQRNSPMADPIFESKYGPQNGSRIGSHFHSSFRSLLGPRFGIQIWTQKWGQPSENFAAARRGFASRFATH